MGDKSDIILFKVGFHCLHRNARAKHFDWLKYSFNLKNLESILKPKNFTELIQSNDYCENECEVNHDGIMSEAQHEACLGKILNFSSLWQNFDVFGHNFNESEIKILRIQSKNASRPTVWSRQYYPIMKIVWQQIGLIALQVYLKLNIALKNISRLWCPQDHVRKMESVNWTEMGIIHRNQMVSFQGGDEKNYSPSWARNYN